MADSVKLTVESQLNKVNEDLIKLTKAAQDLSSALIDMSSNVSSKVKEQTATVENSMDKLKKFGRRVSDQLRSDFASLFSLNAVSGALKLSNQFSGSIKESVALSDSIRKLGSTFGIAKGQFASFQTKMTKGLGDIGLSSEVAARTLEGLADVPVRGEENLLGYSKAAGQLASIGNEKGKEGDIAGGLARIIQARGGDVNDMGQVGSMAEDLRRARNATGKSPTELIRSMEGIFTGMSEDLRKKISTRGLTNLAAAGTAVGPNATKFIQEFMSLSSTQRAGMSARGMDKVFGNNGINTDQVAKLFAEAKRLGSGDVRLGVKAATGIQSDDMAEGFIRLAESLQKVKTAQDAVNSSTGSLAEQFSESKSMGETFQGSINRVKSVLASPLSQATQKGTDLLSKASESDIGSAAVVAGGATAAALLAGGGLRGLGKGLLGGEIKAKAIESITGEHVQKVEVINWPAGGVGGAGGAAGSLAKGAGAIAGAGVVGELADAYLSQKSEEGVSGVTDATKWDALFNKIDKLVGGDASKNIARAAAAEGSLKVKVQVEPKSKEFKVTRPPTRGAAN